MSFVGLLSCIHLTKKKLSPAIMYHVASCSRMRMHSRDFVVAVIKCVVFDVAVPPTSFVASRARDHPSTGLYCCRHVISCTVLGFVPAIVVSVSATSFLLVLVCVAFFINVRTVLIYNELA